MSNLEDMSKEELVDLAQERGIEGRSTMTKQELVAALQEDDRSGTTIKARREDERWIEVQGELASLRREVELARLEREHAQAELRREQEEGWLEKEEQLARLRARETAIRRRARVRARELRDREQTIRAQAREEDDFDVPGDRIPDLDDDLRTNQLARTADDMTRFVRCLATAFADAAGSVADAMMMPSGRASERIDRTRVEGRRGRRGTTAARSRSREQGMMTALPSSALSGLRDVVDRSLEAPSRTVERFYDEYYRK